MGEVVIRSDARFAAGHQDTMSTLSLNAYCSGDQGLLQHQQHNRHQLHHLH